MTKGTGCHCGGWAIAVRTDDPLFKMVARCHALRDVTIRWSSGLLEAENSRHVTAGRVVLQKLTVGTWWRRTKAMNSFSGKPI